MTPRPLNELIEEGWAHALEPVGPQVAQMGEFLRAELAAGNGYLPAGQNVLRAFTFPFERVRVLIVGQDPYPTPGHAVGLSFSVAPGRAAVAAQPGQHLHRVRQRPRTSRPGHRRSDAVGRARGDAAEQGAHRAARQSGIASGQGVGGGDRVCDPGAGRPQTADGGGAVGSRRLDAEADARRAPTAWRSSRRIRRRCRRRAASSARGRSVGPTSYSRRWAPTRSTGVCPEPAEFDVLARSARTFPETWVWANQGRSAARDLAGLDARGAHVDALLVAAGWVTARTVWMLGSHRRLVRRWECDTDLPKPGPFPQISHTAAICRTPRSVLGGQQPHGG